MQHQAYPLPPLLLTEVIEQCIVDHEHTHTSSCIQARRCREGEARAWNMIPVVVSIQEGNGRHECDETCLTDRRPGCMRHCYDSDWVVEVQYHTAGYCAVYGVMWLDGVQDVSLWMDPKLDITSEPDEAA